MSEQRNDIEQKLSAYLDGRLTPDEIAEIETLIEANEEYARLLDRMRRLDAIAQKVMPDFDDDLMDTLEKRIIDSIEALPESSDELPLRRSQAKPIPIWYRYTAVAASIVLIMLVGRMAIEESSDRLFEYPQPAMESPRMVSPSIMPPMLDSHPLPSDIEVVPDAADEDLGHLAPQVSKEQKTAKTTPLSGYLSEDFSVEESAEEAGAGAQGTTLSADDVNSVPTEEYHKVTIEKPSKQDASRQTSPDEIQVAPTPDVGALLKKETGTTAATEGHVQVRGGRAGETTYVVDGVESKKDLVGDQEEELTAPDSLLTLAGQYDQAKAELSGVTKKHKASSTTEKIQGMTLVEPSPDLGVYEAIIAKGDTLKQHSIVYAPIQGDYLIARANYDMYRITLDNAYYEKAVDARERAYTFLREKVDANPNDTILTSYFDEISHWTPERIAGKKK